MSSNTSLVPNMNPEFCLMIGDQAPNIYITVSSNTSLVPNMNPEFCLMIADQAPGCPDVFYKKGSWAAWLLGIPTPHGGLCVNSL